MCRGGCWRRRCRGRSGSRPDGLTIFLAAAGQLTIAKAIGRRLPYDPIEDFTPILWLVGSPVALLAAPGLPGVVEFEASIWTGLSVPAHLPEPVRGRLAAAFGKALRTELVTLRLGVLGAVPNGAGGAAFGAMLRLDLARWTRVAAPLDISLD